MLLNIIVTDLRNQFRHLHPAIKTFKTSDGDNNDGDNDDEDASDDKDKSIDVAMKVLMPDFESIVAIKFQSAHKNHVEWLSGHSAARRSGNTAAGKKQRVSVIQQ